MTRFRDRLAVDVSLTIAGTAHAIPGGSVKRVELELAVHGFCGELEFVVLDDADFGGGFTDSLVTSFSSPDLGEITLSLSADYDAAEAAASPEPLRISGLVTRRSIEELQLREQSNQPILARRYRLRFADPAQVLWTQHFPCRLYTECSLEHVINDQLGDRIELSYDWAELAEVAPLWFVHLPVEHGASFYDFVLWHADRRGGYFAYDYGAGGYTLTGSRASSGAALSLFGDDLDRVELLVPESPRHRVDVCNSYAEAATTTVVTNTQAAKGIRHDRLMRSAIAQAADDRVTVETTRLMVPKYEARIEFARVPIIGLAPGLELVLPAANRWSEGSALLDKTWLVRSLTVCAVAPDGPLDQDLQLASTRYDVELRAELQQHDDLRQGLPGFRHPRYPGFVEGKIVCELGEDGEKTYQSFRNEDTSADEYTVEVPLWDSQRIKAPFEPTMGSSNVYLPSYRDERVLLALELDRARIAQLLMWRDGAALSMDVQGEQILWGKSPTSNTSLNHVYEADKPVFNLARTSDADSVLISLSEGTLVLHVEEQD